jgi:ABC-type glycerol-3-phosphate transport system substrate-binding protein
MTSKHGIARALTRRTVAGGLAGMGGLAFAAACGAGGGGTTDKSPIEGLKPGGTISWSFWAVSQEQADNTLARVKDFNSQNPGTKVEAIFGPSGAPYKQKIISLMSAGTPPECMQVDAYWMPEFVKQGLLQSMDAYIKADKTFKLDAFLPNSFMENHHVFGGKYFAVPNGAESPRVMFYNSLRWQENGLPLPNDLEAQGRWTWDIFLQHMTKFTQTVGGNKNWGINAQLGVGPEAHSWVSSNGGRSVSDDMKTFVGADNKDTIAALEFQADLIHKHQVSWKPGEDLGPGDTFLSGRVAAVLTGVWFAAPLFTRPDFTYRIVPLPKSPKGQRKTAVKPNALTIPVGVKGQPAATAWELIKYISGPSYQRPLIQVGQVITNLKELVDYFLKNSPVKDAKVFVDAYENKDVTPIPLMPRWDEYNLIVNEEMAKVRSGQTNVLVALGSIKSRSATVLGG